jgi:hypothetical protein
VVGEDGDQESIEALSLELRRDREFERFHESRGDLAPARHSLRRLRPCPRQPDQHRDGQRREKHSMM